MSCKHCEITIHTSGKSAWWQGADYVDGIRSASVQAGDAACEHYELYIEECDTWNDEMYVASIPITHCPWCGLKLGGAAMTSATEISLEDVLKGIVGQHYPQGDTMMDEVSMGNMPKLEAIAKWTAGELSCGGHLDGYLNSPYGSMKSVALKHDRAIMELLEWFEPQVKRYYETWLTGDDDD